MPRTRRGIFYVCTAMLTVLLLGLWLAAPHYAGPTNPLLAMPTVALAAPGSSTPTNSGQTTALAAAQRDPEAFARAAWQRYQENVHGYRAVLTKQELVGDKLTAVQEIELRFRAEPRTVYMLWRQNADSCKRALFIDEPEYIDSKGRKLARVEPNGLARLVVSDIIMPIDGAEARKASRHSIEYAGFGALFELLEKYNGLAAAEGNLKFRCEGKGEVDGRPTIVMVRDLPYEQDPEKYPDARLIMHIDEELLLPVAVYSYADHDGNELLGSYVYTDIELNPDFDENAFKF
ncbi:MAG: DUF1571 domain-containing protein [Phycisphaerae bacterium]|nr:DUF1571 domain-containing protein [Phycisphaerae bacterium]